MGVALISITQLVAAAAAASLDTTSYAARGLLAVRPANWQKSRQWGFDSRYSILSISEKKSVSVRAGIHVDRRRHLEESLKRQKEAEAREAEAGVTCPIDCVRVVHNLVEFENILKEADATNDLVVVDFYNSSCGACKYMLPQFMKLCKRGCSEECIVEEENGVIYVKHNVLDEYDDMTDLATLYSIRSVPMFAFFKNGALVEQFPTRDRRKLEQAICRLLSTTTE
ncbi:hypothetical protein O6H91_22G005700 [Diphasiastrum complanatum]|uniref:Uncharacterized protein n=1 Tax=Diphasiastrum complanatum TaxID=34168 RepID=A0ACC2ACD1_DIPCM|nr:hypothetical protein O6H91_22G005700 [Diphasiastrum complanatum]